MRINYEMTIRWWRRACDDKVQFVEKQVQARLNWQTMNTYLSMRLRLTARVAQEADED